MGYFSLFWLFLCIMTSAEFCLVTERGAAGRDVPGCEFYFEVPDRKWRRILIKAACWRRCGHSRAALGSRECFRLTQHLPALSPEVSLHIYLQHEPDVCLLFFSYVEMMKKCCRLWKTGSMRQLSGHFSIILEPLTSHRDKRSERLVQPVGCYLLLLSSAACLHDFAPGLVPEAPPGDGALMPPSREIWFLEPHWTV